MYKYVIGAVVGFFIIFIISVIVILWKTHDRKIKIILFRINESEKNIIKKIKTKADLLTRCFNIIESKLKIESKSLEFMKKIKIDKINDFKLDKQFNKCYTEILKIYEDKEELKKNKAFKDLLKDLEDVELRIISLRTYYNKYTMEYNSALNTFPKNIIGKLKRYELRTLFDGKEIGEEFKNDFII